MTMTQRGVLSAQDVKALQRAAEKSAGADADYRKVALAMVEKSSYREVARVTGLSTATLQRWKRETGQ